MQTPGGWLALIVTGIAWWLLTDRRDGAVEASRRQNAHSVSARVLLMLVIAGLSLLWVKQMQDSKAFATWLMGAVWMAGGAGGLWLIGQAKRMPPR